jgi:3-isopropylmalate/(R)-2-methylmalate dehydratase large subunit
MLKGAAWDTAVLENIKTDADAKFDEDQLLTPMITYGTNPGMGLGISKSIPDSKDVVEGEETYAKSLVIWGSNKVKP